MINFFKGKAPKLDYLAGFLLKQEAGVAYVFTIDHDKKAVTLVEERAFPYSGGWENLIYDIDGILFNIENDYSIRVKKSIFFVYSHLVDKETGELKTTYLDALKAVVKENDLESLGYFELDELLSRSYLELEQAQLNAVFVEVDSAAVSAYVYQAGERIFADSVSKTQDIVSDIEEIFSHVDGNKLPPRIILYDSSLQHTTSDALLVHKWKKDLFIQLPKVDIVKDHELLQAIDIGVRDQVFGGSGKAVVAASSVPMVAAATGLEKETDEAVTRKEVDNDAESVMGFVIGADVAAGTVMGGGSATYQSTDDAVNQFYPQHENQSFNPSSHSSDMPDHFMPSSAAGFQNTGRSKTSIMQSIVSFFSGLNMEFIKGRGLLIVGICAVLLLIGGGAYALLFMYHKAEVTLMYDSEAIEKKISFSDDLNIEEATETFTVSASVPTTGTKDIGEKAKGSVTIYNADEESKKFPKGTTLATSDGISFTITEDITAEAASQTITEDGDILTSTSKTQASAVAVAIGPKSNIKKDVKLKIGSFPETTYFARTSNAFTGGTEKEIQTASKEDMATLDKEIEKLIQEKSKTFLKSATDRNIIESLTSIDKTKESYSKEIAEEATAVDADVTADVTFYSFDEALVKTKIAEEFADEAPSGYIIEATGVDYTITSAEKDEDTGDISIVVEATANPTLKLNLQELLADIQGKSVEAADEIAVKTYKVESFEARVTAPLSFLESRLPYFTKNISIDLKSSEPR